MSPAGAAAPSVAGSDGFGVGAGVEAGAGAVGRVDVGVGVVSADVLDVLEVVLVLVKVVIVGVGDAVLGLLLVAPRSPSSPFFLASQSTARRADDDADDEHVTVEPQLDSADGCRSWPWP